MKKGKHEQFITGVDPLALSKLRPEMSASVPIVTAQKILLLGALVVLVFFSIYRPWQVARMFVLFSTLFYLLFTIYKLVLVRLSVGRNAEIAITREEIKSFSIKQLPVYSILVPMYHEPESAAHMVAALKKLDYPESKKDVQLLLEEDDHDTRRAVEKLNLPSGFKVTLIPPSHPRTKPKACNIGLQAAKGKYLVIYDAEDRPEPDQLKKAVIAFSKSEEKVVCLQSRLNYYNPRQNLLTRFFTAEYSSWFDLNLPGLSALKAVIPLGGTSNHFKTEVLKDMMGWDAYNVTEDCDLGVRIARLGYETRMLNTTTWEEACSNFRYWIRQRTRWQKGYIQTYFVHMRSPWRLTRGLGLWRSLHFHLLIGGSVFASLINPIFWGLALLWFFTRIDALAVLFPGAVFAIGALCLFAGNFVFAYTSAIGCYRRGYYDLVKYAVASPFYWVMMSYSGWRAFFQFFSDPFHWEKTKHGLTKQGENE